MFTEAFSVDTSMNKYFHISLEKIVYFFVYKHDDIDIIRQQ